jgi:hypothetical protein
MYRRIEIIHEGITSEKEDGSLLIFPAVKGGLCGMTSVEVANTWIDRLQSPKPSIPWNARFYFTEIGWDEIGREVIAACQREGQRYRVIAIKENAIDVVFQDEYQVAGQPIRRSRKEGHRRRTDQGKYPGMAF